MLDWASRLKLPARKRNWTGENPVPLLDGQDITAEDVAKRFDGLWFSRADALVTRGRYAVSDGVRLQHSDGTTQVNRPLTFSRRRGYMTS